MIFDDFDQDEDALVGFANKGANSISNENSISRGILEKNEKIDQNDFSVFYRIYEVQINKIKDSKQNEKVEKSKSKKYSIDEKQDIQGKLAEDEGRMELNSSGQMQRSTHQSKFYETHVREDIESDDSEESHSHSLTCHTPDYDSYNTKNKENEKSLKNNNNDKYDNSKLEEQKSAKSNELKEVLSNDLKMNKFKSYQQFIDVKRIKKMRRIKSLDHTHKGQTSNENEIENNFVNSFASLEHLDKQGFDIEGNNSNTCLLCLNEFRLKNYIAEMVTCYHKFHQKCIDDHFLKQKEEKANYTCPKCFSSL